MKFNKSSRRIIIDDTETRFLEVTRETEAFDEIDGWGLNRVTDETTIRFSGSFTVEEVFTDEFKKIASVVGKETAEKVIDALNKSVPENWDGSDNTEDEEELCGWGCNCHYCIHNN